MSENPKMTEEEFNLLHRAEQSMESLHEWLAQCVGAADEDLRQILQKKIRALSENLLKLSNK